jgi:peptidyl-prolyl cis-trans isomerase A (cyclophilin A)
MMKMMVWAVLSVFLFAQAGTAAAANPRVRIVTALGEFDLEIALDKAPLTAANFLRYVDAGLYDGTAFFRTVTMANQPDNLVKIEVIQGGDVSEDKAFPAIAHETTAATGLRHLDGSVSMARAEPGTASSNFFICLGNQPELDFGGRRNPDGQGFAVVGQVLTGMEAVRRIHASARDKQSLTPPVTILTIRRLKSQVGD